MCIFLKIFIKLKNDKYEDRKKKHYFNNWITNEHTFPLRYADILVKSPSLWWTEKNATAGLNDANALQMFDSKRLFLLPAATAEYLAAHS